jgi:uncharacterized protein (TIGR00369 family)
VTDPLAPNATRFDVLPADRAAAWADFPRFGEQFFAHHVGIVVEELRQDYGRLRLPFGDHLPQPAGVVHGGAIATLIDTVVVPAVGWVYDHNSVSFSTITLHVDYLRPAIDTDLVAEGWVERRGRSVVFCRAEVRRAADAEVVATGALTYSVREITPQA